MRVTDKMIYETARRETMNARVRMDQAVAATSTGRRLQHISDDPAAAGLISQSRMSQARLDAIREGVGRASDDLQTMHTALSTASEVVETARTLAVQMANDTYSASDRVGAASAIDGLFEQLVGAMNVQAGNRYLFGGFQDAAAPFDPAGNYLGDTGVRRIEVAPGALDDVSIRADVALKGVSGGVDVFATLGGLATALRGNDQSAIQAALGQLDGATTQVSQALADVSNHADTVIAAEGATRLARDQVTENLARLADVDLTAAASDLALANRALEASLAAAQKSFGRSLLDWLK